MVGVHAQNLNLIQFTGRRRVHSDTRRVVVVVVVAVEVARFILFRCNRSWGRVSQRGKGSVSGRGSLICGRGQDRHGEGHRLEAQVPEAPQVII